VKPDKEVFLDLYNKKGWAQNSPWNESYIEKYLPLVKRLAGRLAISLPAHIKEEDLLSYGLMGLLDALKKYEPSRGVKFETYASLRIRGSMIDGLRAMDWVPQSVRQKFKNVRQAFADLESRYGRSPSQEEVAAYLEISVQELNTILAQGQYMSLLSLEDLTHRDVDGDANFSPIDMIVDLEAQEQFNRIEKEEQKKLIMKAVDRLSEKEKTVVALYYREELTLKEIAKIMNLSESRICQIHSKAILRLRGYLSRQKKNLI
jgi:RNA polymerase sigma factor for flagellar operon FliA